LGLALTSQESEFLNALQTPKLKNTSGDVIANALKVALFALGVRKDNYPNDEGLAFIILDLKRTFGELTIEELRLAFLKCARRELNHRPDPHATISLLYFSDILYSYKQWASNAYEKVKDIPVEKENDFPIYAVKSLSDHRKDIQMGYGHFMSGLIKQNYIPYEWYNVLQDDEFIVCDMLLPKNCLWSNTTQTMKGNLSLAQGYVWQFFELAKKQKRKAIYEQ
jgi:hypothetical protein